MTDDRLRRALSMVDAPVRPDPLFVERLHGRLASELGLTGTPLGPVELTRPRPHGGRSWWWALLAAALAVGLGIAVVGTLVRRGDPPVVVPTSPPGPATPGPTSGVDPSPGASPVQSTEPSLAPAREALRGEGLVTYETGAVTQLPRLRVLGLDGLSTDLLPDLAGVQSAVAWHPSGNRLAFTSYDPSVASDGPRLWLVDVDGSGLGRLPTNCQPPACIADTDAAWSPDGNRVAFARLTDGEAQGSVLVVLDLETGEVVELEATRRVRREAQNFHPRWSPDGGTIAFGLTRYNEQGEPSGSAVWLIAPDGENLRQLTPDPLEGGDPEWSPDGSTILFSSHPIRSYAGALFRDVTRMHLYTIPSVGGTATEFPLVGPVGSPTWSADGSQVLFAYLGGAGTSSPGTPQLYVMEADGAAVRHVSQLGPDGGWYAAQQPRP